MISVSKAQQIILNRQSKAKIESVALEQSLNRFLAEDLIAGRDNPPFNRATMDGIAINLKKNKIAKEFLIIGELQAGESFVDKFNLKQLPEKQAVRIMTGAALPPACNRIIPKEELTFVDNKVIVTKLPSQPFFAKQGENAKKGKLLLKKGTLLGPRESAVCADLGKKIVLCYSLPNVAILSTGNEVVAINQKPNPYQIRDLNYYLLASSLQQYSIKSQHLGLAKDKKSQLKQKIIKGLGYDILIISGAVSAGDYDLIPALLTEVGATKHFHKVSLKPGKPLWFGSKGKTIIFGLPGNPVSVQVCYKLFVEPYLKLFFHQTNQLPKWEESKIKKALPDFKLETYLPAKKIKADLVDYQPFKSSGDFYSLLKTDGLIRCPKNNNSKETVDFLGWTK